MSEPTKTQAPPGFRWKRIINAYGDPMDLLTTDLRTKKGKELLRKAYELISDV